jgi:large subunit ribosomal protein L5
MVRYKELYKTKIVNDLQSELKISNIHLVPRIEKVVLNIGLGEAVRDSKLVDSAVSDLELISGQKPIRTKAKKSEAAFKLREGMDIGCKVTLRRRMMYDFLERLVRIALPRIKGFRGLNVKSFDGRGNFTFGIKEHTIFPEIEFDKIDNIRGMDITIVTSADNDFHARKLLENFSFPFLPVRGN